MHVQSFVLLRGVTRTQLASGRMTYGNQGAVALTVGSVPRMVVPKLRHFHWLLKINNRLN